MLWLMCAYCAQLGQEAFKILTEDSDNDRGFSLLVTALGHTLVDAGVIHFGVVYGEGRRGFIAAAHRNVGPVGEDLLPVGVVPVDVFNIVIH